MCRERRSDEGDEEEQEDEERAGDRDRVAPEAAPDLLPVAERLYRLELPELRLADGETSLTRLAGDLGFADHAHLARVVRREVGQAPSRLRLGLARTAGAANTEVRKERNVLSTASADRRAPTP